MNKYWIFTVKDHEEAGKTLSAEEVFKQRIADQFWGLGERTPNRKNLSKGDKVVFYIAAPVKRFAGTAVLASASFKLNDSQRQQYGHGKECYIVDYGVLLEDIDIWDARKSVEALLPKLKFIENKEFWGGYFQGGVRQLTEEDFRTVTSERDISLVEQIVTSKDIESPAEFALEAHLEEFIYENWEKINWGSKLELYKTVEQNGRQFPAGIWSIDFLAVDKSNNDLVVIELKRGKTSDSAVGQIQRYINWVKDNIADTGQNVKGIIIARKVDEALRYGIKNLDYIDIKTYKVDFRLSSFKK